MNSHLLRYNKTKKIFLFDFETCNLNLFFDINRPWQVAWLTFDLNKVHDIQERKMKWNDFEIKIKPEVAMINHFNQSIYDREAVDEKIVFNEMYAKIEQTDYLMAHNGLGFDIFFLREWYKRHGKNYKLLHHKMIDTNCLAKGKKMNIIYSQDKDLTEYQFKLLSKKVKGIKTKLGIIAKEYNIEHDYANLHDAKTDILLNKKVWDRIKLEVEI